MTALFPDLKVVDLTWVGVGPLTTKYFADHGATVVKVESFRRPDGLRLQPPFPGGARGEGFDRSGFYANYNANKLGLSLELDTAAGRDVAIRLVRWADVLAESYTPRVMRSFGLDYEVIAAVNPRIIMLSTCQQGQTGPYADYPGYGHQGAALAGLWHLTGWPDQPPAGPYGAYNDFINPRIGAMAVAAALDRRRRTGRGVWSDFSQVEGGIQFAAPAIFDASVNGRSMRPAGNRSAGAAPHGVFPCRGDDRWIAIAVASDAEWEALCAVIDLKETGPALRTLLGRKRREEEVEDMVADATRRWDAFELMEALQAKGVPAGVVQKGSDLSSDPQLEFRGHFQWADHPEMGRMAYQRPAFKLSGTPASLRRPSPCLGQHTEMVCREFLGMNDEEFIRAFEGGAFGLAA